jgi:hypothetical protein
MELKHNGEVYLYILQEDEWYSATEQQQQAWINEIMRKGEQAKARYLSILVKPDAVMSISPVAVQHRVWHYTFASTHEDDLYKELLDACGRHVGPGKLSLTLACAISKRVFGK